MVEARAVLEAVEAFRRAAVGLDERAVALVHVGGDELGGFRIRAGHDQGRGAHHVGGEPRGDEVALMGGGGDEHLAAEMAALLLRGELILEMDACRAGLDIGLHDLEGVERPAKARFRVGHDGQEPIALGAAFRMLDLVGPLQGAVDAAAEFGAGIGRVERLVRVHGPGDVGIRRHLPAREIDRLEPRPGHLHGLVAGHGAQRMNVGALVEEPPQALRAALGQGVLDLHRTAEPEHVLPGIGAADAVEAALGSGGDEVVGGTRRRLGGHG
jgi:hypothetical protein